MSENAMTTKQAYWRDIKYLKRPDWDGVKHIELLTITTYGRKAGGMRTRPRTTLCKAATLRDEDGERQLGGIDREAWVEWVPPENVDDLAKQFGWETYKIKKTNPYAR